MSKEKIREVYNYSFKADSVENWAYYDKVFTPEECKNIIDLVTKEGLETATIEDDQHNEITRKSKVKFLDVNSYPDVYAKLASNAILANDTFFGFNIYGFSEGLQFTEYSKGGHYDQHTDKQFNGMVRKLSVVVQLSDPDTYEGGDLELYLSRTPSILSRNQGTVLYFPSYSLHRVAPVTKGVRYSLVGWMNGEPFK